MAQRIDDGRLSQRFEALKGKDPWEWPEDARATLLAFLRDDGVDEDRLYVAAKLAGELPSPDDSVALALVDLVGDSQRPERVRCAAATSLGPILEYVETEDWSAELSTVSVGRATFGRIQGCLRGAYLDASAPKLLRRRALEASVAASADWHAAAVRAAYASGDVDWLVTAVFCMRFVDGFHDEILAALLSDEPEVRLEAIAAAGNWEIEAAWPAVSGVITSGEADRRQVLAAIEAIPTIDPSRAVDLLTDLLEQPLDDEISDAVMDAMAMAEGFLAGEDAFDEDDFDEDEE